LKFRHDTSKIRISLVIPTFNSAGTLLQTLESIRAQAWSEVEVIIVDGASSDATLSIAKQAGDLVSIMVSAPDQGIYDAINKGVSLATGDLIGVIGSDDLLADNALAQVAETWHRAGTDIVAGHARMIAGDGSETLRVDEDFGVGALLSGIPFCHNAMYVTRTTYGRVGLYDLTYKICADSDWVHRSIRAGCSCARIEKELVLFSLGGASSNQSDLTMAETYRIVAGNFPGLNLDDAEALFRAVRGWSDGSSVESVLRRYVGLPELHIAAAVAFLGRARRLAQQTAQMHPSASVVRADLLSRLHRRVSHFLHLNGASPRQ